VPTPTDPHPPEDHPPDDHPPGEFCAEELFEHAPCGYLVTRPDGTILRANQTLIEMTGHPRESLTAGRRFADLLSVAGQVYHDTHFAPLLDMQGFANEVAFDLVCRDGQRLPVLVNAVRRPPAAATTLITVTPATDRRTYERELLLARRRADDAAAAQRAAREQAESASRAKDDFLAMVSHELRTPLNAILGWTQILQTEEGFDDEQREALAVIHRNAEVQAQLIGDLLDMGRILSGKMRLDVQTVALATAIDAAIDTARPAADARGLRLQKVLDPAVTVAGDPGRLQQVFWNLLNNAVKFTPKGGAIRVVMRRVNSHVEVTVTDTGQGMTPEFLAHAFERFSQSDSTATHKTKGLGLGLSIVKSIVEIHGGAIRATSDGPGAGSTFTVDLPVLAVHHPNENDEPRIHPRAALSAAPSDVRGITLTGVRVVVVDDEPDAREMVRRVLAAAGADVVAAVGSAADALDAVRTHRPDVLVSDVGMPHEDGYELIRKVRLLGEGIGRVRAVALTAFTRLEDRTKAMMSGFQMHLAKPVDARELVVTVATLAGR
jgi:PAS domain S-box-containing protein